ncbi:MAG: tetratricopeptide repeat protein [Verrucomicrobiota bacterium]
MMSRLCLNLLYGALLWATCIGGLSAQTGGLSAHDLLQTAFFSYQKRDYALAEGQLKEFIRGYGGLPEAKQYEEKVLRLLSLSQLQQAKFADALSNIEKYLKTYPKGDASVELGFWEGVCLFKEQEFEESFSKLKNFSESHPRHEQIDQVRMMMGMSQLALNDYEKTLDVLLDARETIPESLKGRVLPVVLYCQLQEKQWDNLVKEMQAFDPYAEGMDTLSSVNLLAIEIGSQLMEEDRFREALLVLQKAWPQQRIISRQERRLEEKQEQLALVKAKSGDDKFEELQLQDLIPEIERDLEKIKKIPNYDTALQFRIARCFFILERYREAYLVLAEMVRRLPESELLLQANYQMLVSLTRMERWEEAIESASQFEERFPKSRLLSNVLYLQAEAHMRIYNYEQSARVFRSIVKRSPDFAEVERCHFLAGYSLMMQERNGEAVKLFDQHLDRWPKGDFREQVFYWKAMAFYYDKQYPVSRDEHMAYIKAFPKGSYRIDSIYRRAHALFGQKKFLEAYKELEAFLKKHESHDLADEARNLLGDCYFAMGEIDRGLAAYRQTSKRIARLYDYAQFRIGKALKSTEEYEKMEAHFRGFLSDRPDSPRVTEALSQLAWILRKNEKPEKARDLYWDSIKKYGNDPEANAVEEMMRTLAKYYRGEKAGEYDGKLTELYNDSLVSGEVSLAARCLWMRAQLKSKKARESQRNLLNQILDQAKPVELSPVVLADVADSLRESSDLEQAKTCYRTMLFWYPRSLLKDRSYAGLGLIFREKDDPAKALHYYGLFERETVTSPLWAQVLQSRAEIFHDQGKEEAAIGELSRILEIKSARGKPWVEALYQIGEIHMKQGQPKKAIPYFQRIYIMYGRWADYVAKAYWESGQAFEQLNMREEAINTYQEFSDNTHLSDRPEYEKAIQRLDRMRVPAKPRRETEQAS